MKFLFDINHPAHVHFFKNAIFELQSLGHDTLVTSRKKDVTLDLLEELKIPHTCLSEAPKSGKLGLIKELFFRDTKLIKYALKNRPDAMASIGGTFIAHTTAITRIPSVVFYDTEFATLQNKITYPFASEIATPDSYYGAVPHHKHYTYPGFHELAFLHPKYFTPNVELAINNGVILNRKNFFVRTVAWNANHDIGEKGWSNEFFETLIEMLTLLGNVIISAESPLPAKYKHLSYSGKKSEVHHVLAQCDGIIAESASMVSEAAMLGVPGIYIAQSSRGYIDDLEERYKIVKKLPINNCEIVKEAIGNWPPQKKQTQLSHQHIIDNSKSTTEVIMERLLKYAK